MATTTVTRNKFYSNDTLDYGPFKGLQIKDVDYENNKYLFLPITINDLSLSIEDVDKNAKNEKLYLHSNGGMRRRKTRRSKTHRRKKTKTKSYRVR
jgi:hypothetical protein